jgi:hypothetical protein
MMRNDQKTISAGGRFSLEMVFSPASGASGSCFRISDESFGISTAYFSRSSSSSGMPNRASGAPFGWL